MGTKNKANVRVLSKAESENVSKSEFGSKLNPRPKFKRIVKYGYLAECQRCGFSWNCFSERDYTSCPNCFTTVTLVSKVWEERVVSRSWEDKE